MRVFVCLGILVLFEGAYSASSEEDWRGTTTSSCNHGEGRINYKTGVCVPEEDRTPKSQPGVPTLPLVAPLPPGTCGVRRMKKFTIKPDWKRIISNVPGLPIQTFYGEVPWMVRILADGRFVCGGTLIGKQSVLTAAHCLTNSTVKDWSVEVGEWNASSQIEPNPTQKQKAATVVIHKDFNILNSANNIALIFVNNPFILSETVGLMCLADTVDMIKPSSCFAAGWGKDGQGRKYEYSPILRKVNLPVLSNDDCQKKLRTTSLGDRFELMPSFVCAGGVDERDTCQGDGGGPLYCQMNNEPNRFALYGIIAWGMGCGESNPTVFTSVPHYIGWITRALENNLFLT
uniref:Plasma kallikrein n=1 Tax=Lygus hesperus TaxID=30085 RepID=A0A0A9WLD9_LYGHE